MKKRYALIFSGVLALFTMALSGCGKAPAAGGPPGEFEVPAIVALVAPSTLEERVRLVGSLRSRASIDIVTELSGTLEALLFTEGETVVRGQVLARMRDDLVTARLREAEARYQLAQANFSRGNDLLQAETISQSDFDRLIAEYGIAAAVRASAEAAMRDSVIRAPFDGVVAERRASQGQFLSIGQPITSLIQQDPLEAEFRVPERLLAAVKPGQTISLRSAAQGASAFQGTVFFVSPRVDERSRTVLVKAEVPNPDGVLKGGMFVNLDLVISVRDDALMVPEAAIHYRGGQARVLALGADDRAEVRRVQLGTRIRERVEILEGLEDGDRVVVEGHQKMGPGTKVVIAPGSKQYGLEPTAPTDA